MARRIRGLPVFRCDALDSFMTERACGMRFRAAGSSPAKLGEPDRKHELMKCRGCAIGAAHAAGVRKARVARPTTWGHACLVRRTS